MNNSKRLIFTICSTNYLQFARTLSKSVKQAHPTDRFVVFLVDEPSRAVEYAARDMEIILIGNVAIPDFRSMSFSYGAMELNTAVKPFCFQHAFDVLGYEQVVYLDPDIQVLRELSHVFDALDRGACCVLTPHINEPLPDDGKAPDDFTFMRSGVFNLGFVAFARNEEVREFVRWWGQKLERHCLVDLESGLFVDQKFMDFAPCFLSHVSILRHPGYNLAYWNLVQRRRVAEIYFVHFSGIVADEPETFSKHQNRFGRADIGNLRPIYDAYLAELRANDGYQQGRFSQSPYAFGFMRSGARISQPMRIVYRSYRHLLTADEDPFALNDNFFNAQEAAVTSFEGVLFSRLYYATWSARPDLQRAFDIKQRSGQIRFLFWAASAGRHDIAESYIINPPDESAAWRREAALRTFLANVLTSRSFMVRNLLRRSLKSKNRVLEYWERRLVHIDPTFSMLNDSVGKDGQINPQGDRKLERGVAVYGFFRIETGTGRAARVLAHALATTGEPMSCHHLKPPSVFEAKQEFEATDEPNAQFDTVLLCTNADVTAQIEQFVPRDCLSGRRRIGHWTWELPKLPVEWVMAFDQVDEIWAPSQFVADAIADTGQKPVFVVPYPVERKLVDQASARLKLGLPDGSLLILTSFDFHSFTARKNPEAVVRAFLDAFPNKVADTPRLVIKCHGGEGRDHEAWVRECRTDPRILMLEEVMTDEDVCLLQNACDVFVSLHRSEGFGLNIAESMLLGKVVVATGFSGNTDFMTNDNSYLIPCSMVPVRQGDYPYGEGQYWAEPSHEAAVETLRFIASNFGKTAEMRRNAQRHIANEFSIHAVGRRMSSRLNA